MKDNGEEDEEIVNFLDVSQGLKCWRQCKSCNEKAFAGYVKVKVETASELTPLLARYGKSLAELFGTDSVFAENNGMGYLNLYSGYGCIRTCIFTVIVGNIPTRR